MLFTALNVSFAYLFVSLHLLGLFPASRPPPQDCLFLRLEALSTTCITEYPAPAWGVTDFPLTSECINEQVLPSHTQGLWVGKGYRDPRRAHFQMESSFLRSPDMCRKPRETEREGAGWLSERRLGDSGHTASPQIQTSPVCKGMMSANSPGLHAAVHARLQEAEKHKMLRARGHRFIYAQMLIPHNTSISRAPC